MNVLADAVRVTLGPKARTVVLERSYGAPTVINSGVIVAKELELSDPFENMGAQMVREVAAKTSEVAGDGTTTATMLAAAIVNEGMRQTVRNAGSEPAVVVQRVAEGRDNFGFNAATGEYGDMVKMGVLDPCKVTRSALQNAASIAGLVLTTDCMIAQIPQPKSTQPEMAEV